MGGDRRPATERRTSALHGLNVILNQHHFDDYVELLSHRCYADESRPGLPPGRYHSSGCRITSAPAPIRQDCQRASACAALMRRRIAEHVEHRSRACGALREVDIASAALRYLFDLTAC